MDTAKDREREFVRALMVLGPAPPKPEKLGRRQDGGAYTREQIDAYMVRMEYANDVEKYWLRYVAGIEDWEDQDVVVVPRKIGHTDSEKWIEEFFEWQKENGRENP